MTSLINQNPLSFLFINKYLKCYHEMIISQTSNDRTKDYCPSIIALFSMTLYKPTGMFPRTDVTDSRSIKEHVRNNVQPGLGLS